MQGFKSVGSAQRFLSVHAAAYNTFNVQRHLTSARTHRAFKAWAMQTWREVVVLREPEVPGDLVTRYIWQRDRAKSAGVTLSVP